MSLLHSLQIHVLIVSSLICSCGEAPDAGRSRERRHGHLQRESFWGDVLQDGRVSSELILKSWERREGLQSPLHREKEREIKIKTPALCDSCNILRRVFCTIWTWHSFRVHWRSHGDTKKKQETQRGQLLTWKLSSRMMSSELTSTVVRKMAECDVYLQKNSSSFNKVEEMGCDADCVVFFVVVFFVVLLFISFVCSYWSPAGELDLSSN